MDNIKDLMNSPPTEKISLSAIKDVTQVVSINATDPSTIHDTSSDMGDREIIRISPNIKKRKHRTIDESHREDVNPEDFIEKKQSETTVKRYDFKEDAMNLLDQTVARKRQELHDFNQHLLEADEINRTRIEDGLESVSGEINYLPTQVEKAMELEEKQKKEQEEVSKLTTRRIINDEDDLVDEDLDDLDDEETIHSSSNKAEEEDTIDISSKKVSMNNDLYPSFKKYDDNDYAPVTIKRPVDIVTEDITDEDELKEEEPVEDMMEENVTNNPLYESEPTPVVPAIVEEKPAVAAVVEQDVSTDDDDTVEEEDKIYNEAINKITQGSKQHISTIDIDESHTNAGSFNIADEDFEDIDDLDENNDASDDSEETITREESERNFNRGLNNLKAEILEKIVNTSKSLDTSSFKISNKVVSLKNVVSANKKPTRVAKWPMMYSGRPYMATALRGPEISIMSEDTNARSGISIEQMKILYEHDANPYKPNTVEAWAKTIPVGDIESIYAAIYVASLKGANYMPMACNNPSCQYAYLSENIDINDIVKFNNDEAKKRFEDIKTVDVTSTNSMQYDSVVSVINDQFAVGLQLPSLYTVVYELGSLNDAFINKYTSIISILQYVDYIYLINEDTNEFQPIGWKKYPGDRSKSFRSKIATYAKILKELDDSDFSVLLALINSMITKNSDRNTINYQIPATKCPKCGSDIAAQDISPRNMVFTRQRLVALVTSRTERSQ